MSKRITEVSYYIASNIENESVLQDATEVFNLNEHEARVASHIVAAIIPIKAIMNINNTIAEMKKETAKILDKFK